MTPDELRQWNLDFEHRLTAVRLFGTAAASNAAKALADAIEEAMGEAPTYTGPIENRLLARWEDAIQAMRPDTAPDQS
jgi:hypothetical protein